MRSSRILVLIYKKGRTLFEKTCRPDLLSTEPHDDGVSDQHEDAQEEAEAEADNSVVAVTAILLHVLHAESSLGLKG